jgi:hypothetical protein
MFGSVRTHSPGHGDALSGGLRPQYLLLPTRMPPGWRADANSEAVTSLAELSASLFRS